MSVISSHLSACALIGRSHGKLGRLMDAQRTTNHRALGSDEKRPGEMR